MTRTLKHVVDRIMLDGEFGHAYGAWGRSGTGTEAVQDRKIGQAVLKRKKAPKRGRKG